MFALFLLAPIALMLLPMLLGRIEQRTLQESARVPEGIAAQTVELELPQD
jgi:hypothetical protein